MKQHNTFKSADAFEFVDAYRTGLMLTPEVLKESLKNLSKRIGEKDNPPSYLLAAYRGYESALDMRTGKAAPYIITLDQSA